MQDYLEPFIEELLHINEGTKNKLIDLNAGDAGDTYYLSHYLHSDLAKYALDIIRERIGKPGNTVLRGSSLSGDQMVGRKINDFDWADGGGAKDAAKLNAFITAAYKELNLKGNNPLFLSIGALRWKVNVTRDEVKEVTSPLLIFPIRLIGSTATKPVYIEFVDDEAYFNPCLIHKMRQVLAPETADGFPHPNGTGAFDDPIDMQALGDGTAYFAAAEKYAESCRRGDIEADTVFSLDKDVIAIAQYNHNDICMYYDIKRNRDKIYAHPLVKKIFTEGAPQEGTDGDIVPDFVLPYDSAQENMIRRAVNGESLIIKGPPGTGKTLTIANMIAALMAQGKKVILASKKLSALSEVNAKLPEELRKFAMLMDFETEAQTAKMNPSAVKKHLGELVKARKSYTFDKKHERSREAAFAEITSATAFLADYYEKTFTGEGIVGGTYYDALNVFLKEDLPLVKFLLPEQAAALGAEQYRLMYNAVRQAAEYFLRLTDGGAHPLAKSPWLGIGRGTDWEGAYKEYSGLAAKAEELMPKISLYFRGAEEAEGGFALYDVFELMRSDLSKYEFEKIVAANMDFSDLERALDDYYALSRHRRDIKGADLDEMKGAATLCPPSLLDDITVGRVKTLAECGDILFGADGKPIREKELDDRLALVAQIEENEEKRGELLYSACKVFKKEACKENYEEIVQAGRVLAKYIEGGEKPSLFDLKGKKAAEDIRKFSFLTDVSFRELVLAAGKVLAAHECGESVKKNMSLLSRLLGKQAEDKDAQCLATVKKMTDRGVPFAALAEDAKLYGSAVLALADAAHIDVEERAKLTVRELRLSCEAEFAFAKLKFEAEKARRKLNIEGGGGEVNFARSLLAVRRMFSLPSVKVMSLEEKYNRFCALQQAPSRIKDELKELLVRLRAFGKNYYENHYSRVFTVTMGDMDIFMREAKNRDLISAALGYGKIAGAEPLRAFFKEFEEGSAAGNIPDIFEHSFYGLALEGVMRGMGARRNGLGKKVESKLNALAGAEEKLFRANAAVIERKCMEQIDPDDPDFAFVHAERDPSATLRSIFKKYARAILKLKKCFIITPSTAAVLFRPEEYENFDVVIVDEASQLEPVCLLPVLFRSKQCVIVGDEWQMPPIKHFVAQYERRVVADDGTEIMVLEPELSALTLALRNQAFHAEELLCHYRSKTESLIAFSQEQFYPHMRTFPAPLPKDEGLGFKDVYVDGYCDGGVNEKEARAVVKLLEEHFNRYYDEKAGTLSQSAGVVAFGEKQIERIKRLVSANKELYAKINTALSKFDDVPEKLIFFKTIETVQGQETAHLILSLTYGRTPEGRVTNAFGQLNRDKLGKCIFNVAVTRAQSSVTLVHSVHAYEITGANVAYIHDYMVKAELFNKDGAAQFVSSNPGRGFITSVADYVQSLGISKDRIVVGYGVTKGSIRIPVAVLSPDLKRAQLGIWCETATKKNYNYLDYNMRYFNILKERGWNMHAVYAHEWVNNAEAERDNLDEAVKKYVTK